MAIAKKDTAQVKRTVLTIGHSTHSFVQFVEMLHRNDVTMLVDVRTVPKSRTNPQFNGDKLAEVLPSEKIKYKHMPDLGGLRHARVDSLNTVWQNPSFRGYADYMETSMFKEAVDILLRWAGKETVAIMCAEAVWWRCHRSMVADELSARGVSVKHILGDKEPQLHKLRSFAHVEDGHVSYR